MQYFAWSGTDEGDNEMSFIISPIIKKLDQSASAKEVEAKMDVAVYISDNTDNWVEVKHTAWISIDNIFDTLEEAMRHVLVGLFV